MIANCDRELLSTAKTGPGSAARRQSSLSSAAESYAMDAITSFSYKPLRFSFVSNRAVPVLNPLSCLNHSP
jgi:hypothetical protein